MFRLLRYKIALCWLTVFFLVGIVKGLGQCPVIDFDSPSTACQQQNIYFTPDASYAQYDWDFCPGDLSMTPTATTLVNNYGGYGSKIKIVEEGNSYYGFVMSRAAAKLIRLDFGQDINNTPTVVDLGGLGVSSASWRAIDIIKDGSDYFGFIVDTNELYRIDFGTSIANTPTNAEVVFSGAPLNAPFDLVLVNDAGNRFAFVSNLGDNNIVRFYFDTSFSQTASTIAEDYFAVTGAGGLGGIGIAKDCDKWYIMASSVGDGKLFRVSLDDGLDDVAPGIDMLTDTLSAPAGVAVASDDASYYAFVQSNGTDLYRVNFGSSLGSASPSIDNLGDFGLLSGNWGYSMYKTKSKWIALSVENSGSNIVKIDFPNPCFSNTQTASSEIPQVIPTNAGTYSVSLTATDAMGRILSKSKSLTITSDAAPDISFAHDFQCVNHAINFTSQNNSGDVTDFAWDFGDSGTSTLANTSHTYLSTGNFPVILNVSNGTCTNQIRDTVSVYSVPVTSFNLPGISPLCTNQPYDFVNTTSYDPASAISWQWQVNGSNASAGEDLTFAFSSTSSTDITLIASIPGCMDQHTENIPSFFAGPSVDFSFSGQCQNAPVTFSNETAGTVEEYLWHFGEGSSSSQTNPSHTYTVDNDYDVTLTATTSDGCQNFKTKTVPVYQQPQPDFALELPPFSCSGSPSQFDDATPSPTDSNIASWSWDFGDTGSGNTSTTKNPQHTYADAGDYTVSLETTTNYGCSATSQKTVSIAAAPSVAFTYAPACVGQSTQFTDQSGPGVTDYSWNIDGSFSSSPNPVHTFSTHGDYTVSLSVTGNNDCIAQTSQLITVPEIPSLDFSYTGNCAGNNSTFTDLSTSQNDPAMNTGWTFEGTNATGGTVMHTFAATGTYTVVMNLTTQSGCVYQLQKSLSVGEAPSASFTVPFNYGTSPFKVRFTNTSTQATSYQWNFGDAGNSTSMQKSPVFTFNAVGDYNVSLVAANDAGCSDTVRQDIHVVIPERDIALADMNATPQPDGSIALELTVINNGNLPVQDLPITLDLFAGSIPETIEDVILPGASLDYTFQAHVTLAKGHNYVCAYVDDTGDIQPADNTACITLSDPVVFYAHPNPAGEKLVVDWIGTADASVRIRLVDLRGQTLADSQVEGHEGYNQFIIQTASFGSGLYVLEWQMGNIRKISRIFVQH